MAGSGAKPNSFSMGVGPVSSVKKFPVSEAALVRRAEVTKEETCIIYSHMRSSWRA